MLSFKKQIFLCLGILSLIFVFSNVSKAQRISLNYQYRLALTTANEAPEFIGAPDINYPEEARKNGVEGTLKASFIITKDGTTRDIVIEQSLPFGVEEAVKTGLQRLRFKPAKLNGEPIEIKMYFDYIVSAVYDERDKNVKKPKILEKPEPTYPAKLLAEKRKGKVSVSILFLADGTLQIVGVSSTMPKEFDEAAMEVAKKIKFSPAIHKKSKKAVSQQMFVEYKFKP